MNTHEMLEAITLSIDELIVERDRLREVLRVAVPMLERYAYHLNEIGADFYEKEVRDAIEQAERALGGK